MKTVMTALFLAGFGIAAVRAETVRAGGLVIYKQSTQSDKFANAVEFAAREEFPIVINFTLTGNRNPLRLLRSELAQLVEYPNLDTKTFSTEADRLALVQMAANFEAIAVKYPAAKPFLAPRVARLHEIAKFLSAGDTVVRGISMSRFEFDALTRKGPAPVSATVPALEFRGSVLRRLRVIAVRGELLSVIHDGGIATLPLSQLSPAQIAQLKNTAPLLFKEAAQTALPTSDATAAVAAHSTAPGIIELEAKGVGETPDAALRDALQDAVRRAVGTFVSSEQMVKNDDLIRDQVVAYSDAFVEGYTKLSQKHEQGLHYITIRSRVVQAKVAQQLSKAGLIGKTELRGENMFAEALTKLDKAQSANDLLFNLFQGFPQSVCRATLIGKPAIVSKNDSTATLRLRIRVGVDGKAYAAWYAKGMKVLRQISQKITPFLMPRDEVDTKEYQKAFHWRLYNGQEPSASDDPKIVRFNVSLDALTPIQRQNALPLTTPNSGMYILLSKSLDGFSGEAYLLDEAARGAIITALTESTDHGKSEWRVLKSIEVNFKDSSGNSIRKQHLELYKDWTEHRFRNTLNWPAPYGAIKKTNNQYGAGLEIQDSGLVSHDENRMLLIRPGFILDELSAARNIESKRRQGPPWLVIVTAGVAVDYSFDVPLAEMRDFHHLELSLQPELETPGPESRGN